MFGENDFGRLPFGWCGIEEEGVGFFSCFSYLALIPILDAGLIKVYRLNRIGNLLVPNSNYCAFEDWVVPILDKMVEEQEEQGVKWSPSSVIRRLGKEIDNEDSVYYWCYKVCPHQTMQ